MTPRRIVAACIALLIHGGALAQQKPAPRLSGCAGVGSAAQEVLPVPHAGDVDGPAPGPPRLGEHALPHGGARRAVERGRDQGDGELSRRGLCEEAPVRELVARYLSRSISRRSFLKGMSSAGISLAAAESILESLVPAAHAQGADGIKLVEGTGAE